MATGGYLRFPHLHGDMLTFVADDDVWLAPLSGGRAWRVSSDRAQVSHPRLSRDGSMLAWASARDGAPEIRVCDLADGRARRLTYWGDRSTRPAGWSPAGEILALTAAGQPFERFAFAYALPAGGGPRPLDVGPVAELAVEQSGVALLTGTSGWDPAQWKRYRGGTAGRIWVRPAGQEQFSRILAGLAGQVASPMLVAGRLVFLADHEGTGNLYSCQLDGTELRRHTDHDGFYARQASTDGHRVVYQCAGEIWLLDGLAAESRPVAVSLGAAAPAPAPRLISAQDQLEALSCDHSGRASAIAVAGTVHWLTHEDGPARALSVAADARARLPEVLGTTGEVVWVTDAGGEQALEVAAADGTGTGGPGPLARLAAGQLGMVEELAAAPDGAAVAVASRDGRLHLVDMATGGVRLLAVSPDGPVSGLSFAPDSAWLAWSQPDRQPLSQIRLARLTDGTVVDVTDGRFSDTEPVFSRDGKYLAFLSRRSFDPVYDAHFFDLAFPRGCRPYLVTLAAATPSPFAPQPGGRPPVTDDDAGRGRGPGGAGPGDAAAGEAPGPPDAPVRPGQPGEPAGDDARPAAAGPARDVPVVTVDTDGLPSRVVGVPVAESLYSSLRAVTGGLAWLRSEVTGVLGEGAADPDDDPPRPALERFDLAKRTCSELVAALDWFEVSGDGGRLVIRDRGELRVIPAESKDTDDGPEQVQVDLSRARFLADPQAQRAHAFAEAGRLMRHDFWVADMAGVDWDGVLDSYRPLLAAIRTADDFADLIWEIFGELGCSHAYVWDTPPAGEPASPPVGYLGADLVQAADGSWQVARVLPGESSDPRARSPLSGPGAAVAPGATLLAVDGQPVDPAAGPGPLLVGAVRKPVELTVSEAGRQRRVAVIPLASERRLRYQDWVTANRRQVRELTAGQAGYLHVPDMMGEGWAHFHRDLRVELARDALILDVRQNRGGHVSELVVEKLARRIMGWELGRGLRPSSYPRDAPRGPVVALTDEFAGSDGDMITAALRILGLGPVVGTRTWGGVLGIDDRYRLVDGTSVTLPKYGVWLSTFGWGVENHGVDPDVEVVISPADWAAGRDPQLATAVRLALAALQSRPAARPPDTSQRPSRTRPPLPPRAG
ncbi:MAG TPA: S41 family peptidase [Streptosporangiaceae bacterium]|nr:S41 family peptidase [Streptosporangiaceae bacterium]